MDEFINEKLQKVLDENIAHKNLRFVMAIAAVGVALVVCPPVTIFFGIESFLLNKKIRLKVKSFFPKKYVYIN